MKKIYLLLFTALLFLAKTTVAQITIAGSTGTANGTYTSLTNASGAFAALNTGGSHNAGDVITISITADVTTEAGTNSLNAGTWASITVTPTGVRTISGSVAAPLINFNGADNVTINGLNSGGNSLTISNTSTASTTTTSTIRFIADATSNTVTNCSVLGSSTTALGTNGGTIFFSTSTTTGNDNNTISNCDIGPAGTNLPTKAIYGNGSTGATARNSGVTINNNNIFDFFSATQSVSGIHVLSGNDTWTISNNKIYQTGARTFTSTALRYAGITLNSTGGTLGSFTVTGNTIGFGASNGTGTTTITGSTNEFRGIDALSVNTGTATTIQNNIISGIVQTSARNLTTTTSSCFNGIALGAGTDGLFNVTSNTIGSLDASSSIIITATSTTASTTPVIGILDFSLRSNTISSNNIGTITINSGGTGTAMGFRGILIVTGTGLTETMNNNIIGGTAAGSITNNVVGAGVIYAIQVSGPNISATGNVIRNITGNSTGASSVVISGILTASSTGVNTISQNSVYSLQNNSGAASNSIYGIYCSFAATANIVERNFVHSLSINSTAFTSQLAGILPVAGSGTYKNNMVRLGMDAAGSSITGGYVVYGMFEIAGTNNLYHNSVYIGGSSVVSVSNTFAFVSNVSSGTRNYNDNIFWNARSNTSGTGKNYAIAVPGTAPNPAGLTTDYNDLYANGTGGYVGLYNSIDRTTISDWRTATGQDNNSVSGNPQFLLPNGPAATVDLHIDPAVPTQIEGAGTLIASVTNDYDGQTRSGLTPVDIGADAGNFIALDLTPPSITAVTLVGNSCNTVSRNVTATITDITGVDNASFKPTIYFNKNGGAYFSTQGTLSSGTINNGSWTFTINYGLLGGVVATDVIRYFIVAQDVVSPPNAGGTPSAGLTLTDVNTILTPPTTPLSYTIGTTLSGTYLVGAGQTYTTITAAVAAYNSSCLGGPVVFQLMDAAYAGETFPITINANTDASSVNTLTIKPATGVSPTVTGANATALFDFNGAIYVTIDGSNALTSKDLIVSNTNTSGPVVRFINGASNNMVKNSQLKGVSTATTNGVVFFSTSSAAAGNNSNTISNNDITMGASLPFYGIYNSGTAAKSNTNISISGNKIFNFSGAGLFDNGNSSNISIANNEIYGTITQTTTGSVFGVRFQTNTIIAPQVTSNYIHDLKSTSTTASTLVAGIHVFDIGVSTGVFSNNIISLSGNGAAAPLSLYGILDEGDAGENINTYYNTVLISGTSTSTSNSVAFQKDYANTSIVKDNIFVNTRVSSGSGKQYAIFKYNIAGTGGAFTSDYNDLYSSGNALNILSAYGAGSTPTDYNTIAAWRTASGQDANSLNVQPFFVSSTDLHLTTSANCALDNMGNNNGILIATDFDGNTRSTTTPFTTDIGADEFTGDFLLTITNPPASCSVDLTAAAVTVGSSTGTTLTYWEDAGATVAIQAIHGTAAAITTSGTYYIKSVKGTCSSIQAVVATVASTPATNVVLATNSTNGVDLPKTCDDASGWTYYTDPGNASRYLFAIQWAPADAAVKAAATVRVTVDPAYFTVNDNSIPWGTWSMNRYWNVDLHGTTMTGTANVRFFYDPTEKAAIDAQAVSFSTTYTGTLEPSTWFKTKSGSFAGDAAHMDADGVFNSIGLVDVTGGASTINGVTYAQFNSISSFSGGGYASGVGPNTPLPITLNYLRGVKQGNANNLSWKVTCNSTPKATLTLERSADATNFAPLYTITADALRCQQPFDHQDANPLAGRNYYRLKMVDNNGKITYSNIIVLLNDTKGFEVMNIAPNPVTNGQFKLNVTSAENTKLNVVIIDMQGRVVQKQTLNMVAGYNSLDMNVINLASGTYSIYGTTDSDKSKVIRFVKQ